MSDENVLTDNEELLSEEETIVDTRSTKLINQLTDLQGKIEMLAAQNAQLAQMVNARNEPIQKPQLTPEQAQRFVSDPTAMAEFLKGQVDLAKVELQTETQKQTWDDRAKREFPVESDPSFKNAVAAKIRELTSDGEYTVKSPKLVYRACQLVANELGTTPKKANPSREAPTSAAPSTVSRQGQPGSQKSKVQDTDPRIIFARAAGIEGKELEKFRERLGPYVREERAARGRTLMRGNR